MSPKILALADQMIVSGCNFLTALFLARFLTLDEFGHYSLASLVCLFLSNIHRAAFTQPMSVLLDPNRPWLLLARAKTLIKAHALAAPLGGLLIAILASAYFPDPVLALSVIVYLGAFMLQETCRRFWYANGKIERALYSDLISYAGQLMLLLVLAKGHWLTQSTAFVAMTVATTIGFAVSWFHILQEPNLPHAQMSIKQVATEHWPLSKWLVITVLAIWGAGNAYPFLMSELGPVAVAALTACRNLLNVMSLAIQSISNYVPTQATKLLCERGIRAFKRQLITTALQATAGGALFILLLQFLAEPILNLVYGGKYNHEAGILKILAFNTACTLIGTVFGAYAIALRDARSGFLSNLGASMVTFTFGLWLIHNYGLQGAAIGTLVSSIAATLLQGMFVFRNIRVYQT